jgi:two-component system OmpR family sensor kinase
MNERWEKTRWLLPLVILVLGLGLSLLVRFATRQNPVLYLRADLATLILLAGVVLTILGYAAMWIISLFKQQRQRLTSQATVDRMRFIRRLDHELKNPLTAIRAGLANISEALDANSRDQALLTVEAQALRLSRLAADLRKLAELETRPLEQASIDVTTLLQEAFDLVRESANEHKFFLNIPQAPWPLPKISGDPDLLFLALHNLLENAVKFTSPGDTVEIRAFEDGNTVVIEVADTGLGIPEQELSHVWEELYRGHDARGIPGSGLGLALVRAVIERHGGWVSLRSRVGQGSVFTLRLPVG